MRSLPKGAMLVTVVIVAVLACDPDHEEDDNNFREDVITCEDAVARLASCCPDFRPASVECNYHFEYQKGCGTWESTTLYPSLSVEESECIRRTSCSELVAADVCTRAAEVSSRVARAEGDAGSGNREPQPVPPRAKAVCP